MKLIAKFLLAVFSFAPAMVTAAPVSTTAGSNLTGYNGSMGSAVGNQWNNMMNPRSGNTKTEANYDNCGVQLLRCAKPKCAGGGCNTLEVAKTIARGCLNSNNACKKHGDNLVDFVAGQLMSESVAAANKQAAETAAAQAAAQQNNQLMQQQLQSMQQQMQQMQAENNAQMASLQNALAESQSQVAAAATAAAEARNAEMNNSGKYDVGQGLTPGQQAAIKAGVQDEIVQRATITGEIVSDMEGVTSTLERMKNNMRETFRYGECNEITGNDCKGPKRVKKFKEKAMRFFDPYDELVNKLESAILKGVTVGLDLNDVYMMLSGSCNRWAEYICSYSTESKRYKVCTCADSSGNTEEVHVGEHDSCSCPSGYTEKSWVFDVEERGLPVYDGTSCVNNVSRQTNEIRGGQQCIENQVVPPEDLVLCRINKIYSEGVPQDTIKERWLNPDKSSTGIIRIGCAGDLIKATKLKHRSNIGEGVVDIDVLTNMIVQDAPSGCKEGASGTDACISWCGVAAQTDKDLVTAVRSKSLDQKDNVCYKADFKTKENCEQGVTYINPKYALCSVHAYNANMTENPTSQDDITRMKSIIGLKTTVIAQQMYKQYTMVEQMVKRLQIQIEKSALKAELQVASGGASAYDDDDTGSVSAQFQNCGSKVTHEDALECLKDNYSKYQEYVSKNNTKKSVRKQMYDDVTVLNAHLNQKVSAADCDVNRTTTSEKMQKCLYSILTGLNNLDSQIQASKRSSQNVYYVPGVGNMIPATTPTNSGSSGIQ